MVPVLSYTQATQARHQARLEKEGESRRERRGSRRGGVPVRGREWHREDEAVDVLAMRHRSLEVNVLIVCFSFTHGVSVWNVFHPFVLVCNTHIEEMSNKESRDLLLRTARTKLSLFLDVFDSTPHSGYHPQPGGNSLDLCTCQKCRRCRLKQKNVVAGTADNCQSDLPVSFFF